MVYASVTRKDLAIRFSGTGYVECGSDATYNFAAATPFSIFIWTRWTQATTGHMVGRVGTAASNTGWSLYTQGAKVRFSHKGGGVGNRLVMDTVTSYNDGKWHKIVLTYDGSLVPAGVHIYVDNVDQTLTTVENTLVGPCTGVLNLEFGRDVNQAAFEYTGDIGGVGIFSAVVSGADRTVLYGNRKPPAVPSILALSNLLGYWRCGNQDTFPTVKDRVAATDGTMTNLTGFQTYAPAYY